MLLFEWFIVYIVDKEQRSGRIGISNISYIWFVSRHRVTEYTPERAGLLSDRDRVKQTNNKYIHK